MLGSTALEKIDKFRFWKNIGLYFLHERDSKCLKQTANQGKHGYAR